MCPCIHCSITYNSHDMEAAYVSINRRKDKEDVACTHTHIHVHTHTHKGILVIKRNEIMPFTITWMDLEGVMLSEVSQKKIIPYDFIYMWKLKTKQRNKYGKQQEL